ncbi:MAG: DUF2924 domain-containing protein [Rhodospirillaceae bacterium]|nr:DUF2924 domain-containing protein [Rhodospirillaceae bacterium]
MTASPPCETADKIEVLHKLSLVELKSEWIKLHKQDAPPTARRDYLVRSIAHRLQEQDGPRLPASIARRLELSPGQPMSPARPAPTKLREGSKLLREYQGTMHEVEVVERGYSYGGQRYASLSEIARKITGTRWSGPLFFGLKRVGSAASVKSPNPKFVVDLTTPDAPRRGGGGVPRSQEAPHVL